MAKILDGRVVREELRARLKDRVVKCKAKPTLAIIQVGENPESDAYIKQKKLFGESIGVTVNHIRYKDNVNEQEVIQKIKELNNDENTHGIIVQIPLPNSLDKNVIVESIVSAKDVDGLTAVNLKKLWENKEGGFMPATAKGILSILDFYKIPVAGKLVTVVGRSTLVGKPTALLLTNHDATVTLCHSKTLTLKVLTKKADILVVATGKPKLITHDFVSKGQVIIDVGINPIRADGASPAYNVTGLLEELPKIKLVGDVDFEAVKEVVSAISPVPGGVGPMTVASLFENLISAYEIQLASKKRVKI